MYTVSILCCVFFQLLSAVDSFTGFTSILLLATSECSYSRLSPEVSSFVIVGIPTMTIFCHKAEIWMILNLVSCKVRIRKAWVSLLPRNLSPSCGLSPKSDELLTIPFSRIAPLFSSSGNCQTKKGSTIPFIASLFETLSTKMNVLCFLPELSPPKNKALYPCTSLNILLHHFSADENPAVSSLFLPASHQIFIAVPRSQLIWLVMMDECSLMTQRLNVGLLKRL